MANDRAADTDKQSPMKTDYRTELEQIRNEIEAWNAAQAGLFRISDLLRSPHERLNRVLDKCVEVDVDRVVLHFTPHPYEIDMDSIQTPEALLGWTVHLAGKAWMPKDGLRVFVRKVAKVRKWSLYWMKPYVTSRRRRAWGAPQQ